MGPDVMVLIFWMMSFKPKFSLSSHFHREPPYFFFTFCSKGDIICISDIVDISPSNLNSSLFFRSYDPCHVGPPKIDGSWWRVLKKRGPMEKGMANHFRILALRIPWTVWKGKKTRSSKMNCPGHQVPNMLLEIGGEITPDRMKRWSQSKNNTQL